jgi:hypothetical protein
MVTGSGMDLNEVVNQQKELKLNKRLEQLIQEFSYH